MAEASIPVDLFNPGQVFACLGFLEAAEVLLGDAEGGFDWSDEANVKFILRAAGERNPFEAVLEFLAEAEIVVLRPNRIEGPWPAGSEETDTFPSPLCELKKSDGKGFTASSLPIRLERKCNSLSVSHWLEGDGRKVLKLFAGQQVGSKLAANALYGDPKEKSSKGFRSIFPAIKAKGYQDPFDEVCAVGGRFGFDARGGWDAMRIGTSLDKQGVLLKIAPHVEILAAIGLENARPDLPSAYQLRYAVWHGIIPISLCRIALSSPETFLPKYQFRFFKAHLGNDKQYKKCFFAELEE